MLSYQHRYHAGCFADVHKHLLLSRALVALRRKEKPFCVIDAHGGEGVYDLHSEEATTTAEASVGIETFLALENPPELVEPFMQCLQSVSAHPEMGDIYPGSPAIAQCLMREQDRLLAIELHPQAYSLLKENMANDSRVHVHKRDAMEAVLAFSPPLEKRGIVVIDPAYELKSEYQTIPAAVAKSFHKWRGGVYFIWYPILPDGRHEDLLSTLEDAGYPEIFISEWLREPENAERGMCGSGVAVINPPWHLDEEAQVICNWLESAGFGGTYRQCMLTA